MRVIESRLLRRIFGSIWKEVAGGWKRLHSEEFHELLLLFYDDQIKDDEVRCSCST
jgi:hypothetical protein